MCTQEIEKDHRDCVEGENGRYMQYHDPDFTPDPSNIGDLACAPQIKEWKASRALNPAVQLFCDGTDPEDIYQGVLGDGWLLSALSILASSGMHCSC